MGTKLTRMSSAGGRGLLVAGACLVLAAGATGCGSPTHIAANTAGSAASATTKAAAGRTLVPKAGPADDNAQSSTAQQTLPKGASTAIPSDPLATSVTSVKRAGMAAQPSIRTTGGAKAFTQSIQYTDGLRLTITRMAQGKVTGQGPGVFSGRAVTDFFVTLTNGTKKALSFDSVIVTVSYGSPARLAHSVYDAASVDFAGTVQPGKSGHATYGFSVPAADVGNVTLTVDLDGIHQLAIFKGKVT